MKKVMACLLAAAAVLAADPPKPKLVLAIVIDQFRYDYLTRFRAEYQGGFVRLLTRGAVFTNAHYEHFPTVTAIGHSTFLSGATPALSGIIGNDWYDREEKKTVTSVEDASTQLLGGTAGAPGPPGFVRRAPRSTCTGTACADPPRPTPGWPPLRGSR